MDRNKNAESSSSAEEMERVLSAIEELEKCTSSMRLWLKLVLAALVLVWLTVLLSPLFLPLLIAPFL